MHITHDNQVNLYNTTDRWDIRNTPTTIPEQTIQQNEEKKNDKKRNKIKLKSNSSKNTWRR